MCGVRCARFLVRELGHVMVSLSFLAEASAM
jgi:hypothetical protein